MEIRPYEPRDLPAVYRICLATAAAGSDASRLYRDPLLVGHVYAAPYAIFAPHCCFIAQDRDSVAGYIIGACDTSEFERQLEVGWWPELRRFYPNPAAPHDGEWKFDLLMMRLIHRPARTPDKIANIYPSHLHINLLPRMQGKGSGRSFIDAWLNRMREMGSRGAHLAVGAGNERAIAFYRHYGFHEIERTGRATVIWFGITL